LKVTVFWHMRSDVTSEQMAVKLGMLMEDQLLIPNIFKSHFGKKIRATVFWLCTAELNNNVLTCQKLRRHFVCVEILVL